MNADSIPGFSDPFSSISHLLGAFVFLFYGFKLIHLARGHRGWVAAVSIFVFSVVFLLSMSGVFHLLDHQGHARAVLQRLDHAGIFGLIAGTFTPVHSILFNGFWRWGILFLIWTLAITGITLKSIFFNELAEWLGLMFYLGLGWVGILSAYLTHRLHGFTIIKPLIYGALAYTAGANLEYLRMPIVIPGVIGPHELFHIAVLLGIAWHWKFISNLIILKRG
ncbi:MAG: hemolysin III family protein [Gammaproteobacteria bacterium]|nr:MAG: hemolysin III family protein [Gammaproteobacteria bacterium]